MPGRASASSPRGTESWCWTTVSTGAESGDEERFWESSTACKVLHEPGELKLRDRPHRGTSGSAEKFRCSPSARPTASSLRTSRPAAKIKGVVRLLSRALAGLGAALLSLTVIALPATAEPPGAVDGHVVDDSSQEVLAGQEEEITAAIDELRSDTDLDLWVVYVDSFDEMDQQEWAAQSAQATGLGNLDILWAVAVEDRQTGLWANEAAGLRSEEHTSELQSRGHLVCRLLLE